MNQAGFESMRERIMSRDGLENRGGEKKKAERSKDGLRKNVLEAEVGREMFTSVHPCRAHVSVSKPSVMYSRLR